MAAVCRAVGSDLVEAARRASLSAAESACVLPGSACFMSLKEQTQCVRTAHCARTLHCCTQHRMEGGHPSFFLFLMGAVHQHGAVPERSIPTAARTAPQRCRAFSRGLRNVGRELWLAAQCKLTFLLMVEVQ